MQFRQPEWCTVWHEAVRSVSFQIAIVGRRRNRKVRSSNTSGLVAVTIQNTVSPSRKNSWTLRKVLDQTMKPDSWTSGTMQLEERLEFNLGIFLFSGLKYVFLNNFLFHSVNSFFVPAVGAKALTWRNVFADWGFPIKNSSRCNLNCFKSAWCLFCLIVSYSSRISVEVPNF